MDSSAGNWDQKGQENCNFQSVTRSNSNSQFFPVWAPKHLKLTHLPLPISESIKLFHLMETLGPFKKQKSFRFSLIKISKIKIISNYQKNNEVKKISQKIVGLIGINSWRIAKMMIPINGIYFSPINSINIQQKVIEKLKLLRLLWNQLFVCHKNLINCCSSRSVINRLL